MPSLTIKNMPKDLHARLKDRARRHNRSLNGEILEILDGVLRGRPLDPEALLQRIARLRERTAHWPKLTDEMLDAARDRGRV